MRRVCIALVTLLAFGCATVRVPVATAGEPEEPAGAIAPPMLELWLENPDPVPPEERAHAEQQARAALDAALRGRRVSGPALGAADPVLFVRERAVGVTEARRSQQTWAKVGIVAGIVVVVAVVVIAIVAGKEHAAPVGKGSHSAAPVTSHAVGVPVRARPIAVPPVVARPPPVAPTVGHAAHLPRYWAPRVYGGDVPLLFWFDFWLPPRPIVLVPEGPEGVDEPPPFPPDEPVSPLVENDAPPPEPAPAPSEPPPPPPPPEMQLPPLAEAVDFAVRDRSFFDGPRTAVQVDLLDRKTGHVVWTRAVADDVDPLDPAAVKKLLDDALDGEDWALQ